MLPNPADMLVFAAVAELRSFTLAAERIGRTPSAVSQSVAKLERDLNCRLLYRTTRSISLTEEGTRALSHFLDLQQAYERVQLELRDTNEDPSGLLTVTAPHALGSSHVVPAITAFCEEYENVRIRLLSDDAPLDAISRRIDIAIRVGMPTSQQARVTKVADLSEALFAHRVYVERQGGAPKHLKDIAEWDHIANEWQGSPVQIKTSDGETIKVAPRYRCNSAHDVVRLVETGAGVALLANEMVQCASAAEEIETLFTVASTPIYAVHHYERSVPTKVSAFLGVLKNQFRTD